MVIKAQVSQDGEVLTISISGRFDAGICKEFTRAYKDELGSVSSCVIDMTDVEAVASIGVGALIMFIRHTGAESTGKSIINCNPEVKKSLVTANLDKLIRIE